MITHTDDMVEDIVQALKSTGLYENTIIIFSSDNGGIGGQGPDSIEKFCLSFGLKNSLRFHFDSGTCLNYQLRESQAKTQVIFQGKIQAEIFLLNYPQDHLTQAAKPFDDSYIDRNYPFRGQKREVYEGGVRVAGFVHSPLLPDKVRGTTLHEVVHVTDWVPTIVAATGMGVRWL